MKRLVFGCACVGVLACGSPGPAADQVGVVSGADTLKGAAAESVLLAEVTPPQPVAGKWVGRTPLREVLTGALPVRAGRCADPPSVQVMAQGDSIDALVVVYFGVAGGETGEYRVVPRDQPPPQSGYARVGVQRVGYVSHFYEAVEGFVILEELGRSVRGRVEVVLREVSSWEKIRYAAVFSAPGLEPWPEEYCGAPVPPDSISALDRPIG
ncbi:MAG: hypothetical protein KatS3mg081_2221 [Gemmatimonadales bacterium]|nr:MAG: hypothetical protein KatS3mg081_2221 [Gemmatimonadales bacterium]